MAEENKKIIIESTDDYDAESQAIQDALRVFVFSLGKESYASPVRQVKEIIKPSGLTKVYGVPEFVIGVMNLRGDIVAVLDLGYFFGAGEAEKTRNARVVVVEYQGSKVGFMVDRVVRTADISGQSVQPPLATLNKKVLSYTTGQIESEGSIIVLVDFEKILNCAEISELRKGGVNA